MRGYDPLGSVGGPAPTRDEPVIRLASPVTGPDELEAVGGVLASGILTNGPWTRRFEDDMAKRHGTEHGVALANGTVALAAMLLASGIGEGDEVIVPSIAFFATASSILHVGATPVFADIEADTLNLDPEAAAAAITARTAGIVPVHYAGQPADMTRFRDLADAHDLVLLEDAAQAHGATIGDRPAGAWGDAAMFSFSPTKNITTGEGAVVTTDDTDLADRMRLLRNHGMSAPYRHDVLGHNWRLSELHSAMGVVQLGRLDGILERKHRVVDALRQGIGRIHGIEPLAQRPDRNSSHMIFTLRIDRGRRPDVIAALDRAGIEHHVYFPPIHRQAPFVHLPDVDLPATDAAAGEILSIPCHVSLDDHDITLILGALADALA